MHKLAISLFLVVICSVVFAWADIVYLNNGRNINGIVTRDDDDEVELQVNSGTVTFPKKSVTKIIKGTDENHQAMQEQWKEEKKELDEKIAKAKEAELTGPKAVKFVQSQGGMVVGVVLNGKTKASFVVDTGCSSVLLRKSLAQELGIDLETVQEVKQSQLADGRLVNVKFINLDSLSLGDNIVEQNVEASVILEDVAEVGEDGLLGMSFLKRFNMKIDQKHSQIILERVS